MKLPQWMPSANQITQCNHFFIATTVVLTSHFMFGFDLIPSFGFVILWGLVKEFGFDQIIERDTLANSMEDFKWYLIGGISMIYLIWLKFAITYWFGSSLL